MDVASTTSGAGKVGKLKQAAKRRWKKQPSKESFRSTASSEELRGRSPHSRVSLTSASVSTTQSLAIQDQDQDDGEREGEDGMGMQRDSSPDAYVSDHDSAQRPSVPSSHPSQIGQLTTSSPIIQAGHLPELQSQASLDSLAVSSDPSRPLSSRKPGLELPATSSPQRSVSPVGRIKDAFRSKRSASNASAPDNTVDKTDYHRSTQNSTSEFSHQVAPATGSQSDTNDTDVASTERTRRARPAALAISGRPQTPPTSDSVAPLIVNTPPTPTDSHHSRERRFSTASSPNSNVIVSPSGSMISHRRHRSGSGTSIGPSKLSHITSAPLTPTPENAVPPTPGSAGFFSSVLSAAQNAATTLSSTITNSNIGPGGNKPKNNIPGETQVGDDDRVEVELSGEQQEGSTMSSKEPAVKTLGMGDLSLSHLGIQEGTNNTPTPTTSKFSDSVTESRARSESAPVDSVTSVAAPLIDDGRSDDGGVGRPKSFYESAGATPPTSVYEGKSGIPRSGSIRSALGRRRKRGSTGGTGGTTGTGTTIGAAIAAANASVAHPHAAGSVPKLTGFAVASKKRNRDFHALFKSVPDDDYLIEDYSCALQREILAHGRLYVSENHLCFSSNIFGWVTTLVMSFDEIVSVEKRSTALLFKNGLMITTLHAKHVFASFTSRDSTYDLIVNIWKIGHPTLRSTLNGVSLEETGGDKTEKVEDGEAVGGSQSGSGSELDDSEDGDDIYDEDQEDEDLPEVTLPIEMSPADTDGEKAVARKVSGAMGTNIIAEKTDGGSAPAGPADFPGPATHVPTDCGDSDTHFDVVIGDDIVAAPLGKVYNFIFGPTSVTWMSKWLSIEQKCTDLQMEDKKGLSLDNKTRVYTYIKPLYASIGPKQTKCIVTETLENLDLEKSVNVLVTTQTPDVPSGNVFSVKTKYCLSWAENNATHVTINCCIEWTGKSWLKGPIEKGAKDGQMQYWKDLSSSLKVAVSSRPRSATLNGAVGKGKKKKGKGRLHRASKESLVGPVATTASKTSDWGPLEPLHGILGPVFDILKPVMTGNVVYGLLVGLLVATWFGFGFNGQSRGASFGRELAFMGYPERAVAYEEIWKREETDLWDWLEERVGLHRVQESAMPMRKRVMEARTAEGKLCEERMNEREVEEAIRVTEEKLHVLKSVMDRKKDAQKPGRPTTKVSTTER